MKLDSHTGFLTTQWSLVDAIQSQRPDSAAALNRLVEIYLGAVYAFLRRSGHRPDAAADIAQSFFTEVVIGRLLFHNANSSRGSLRSLILRALSNFVIDGARRDKARRMDRSFSIDALEQADALLSCDADPSLAFNHLIARAQFSLAIDRCREHFAASGLINHWRLFEAREYFPSVHETEPPPLKECYAGFGFASPARAAAAVQTVKRALLAGFREVVAESLPPNTSPDEIDQEFSQARHSIAGVGLIA